ncbi:MAG: cobalamin biosynthesis protein [Succinivibrio sp.]
MPVEQILSAAGQASFSDIVSTFFDILQYPAVTLLVAMLLEIVLPIKNTLKPAALIPLFSKMASKVNREDNQPGQNVFSSIFLPFFVLSIALFALFTIKICLISHTLAALILLPLLLDSKSALKTALEVKRKLDADDKNTARGILQKVMLRDCSKLSELGINKALCEMVSLKLFINWFAVMVWYMIFDLEGAVIMQTVSVLSRAYSHKIKKNEVFGLFTYKLEQTLLIPPAIVFLILMLLSAHAFRIVICIKRHIKFYPSFISSLVSDIMGGYADTSLGGPRVYEGNLIRITKVGTANEPTAKSPLKIYNKIRFTGILFTCICVLIKIFVYTAG